MKFLLINPIIGKNEPTRFPLGLGYIARTLLDNNHKVQILDNNTSRFSKETLENEIGRLDFDAAGITGLITEYKSIKWFAQIIKEKKPDAKIVLGGGLATAIPELILKRTDADITAIGECESTIKELGEAFEDDKDISRIKGIWLKKNGRIEFTGERSYIKDLDTIPFPAREIFPMEKYISGSHLKLFDPKIRTTNMVSSRGCPYSCTFCFKRAWGEKFRARSPENIIEEIRLLQDKYRINGIEFNDDTFILDRSRVTRFCDLIAKEGIDISWLVNGRVNLVNKELLAKMRKAGCRVISYGIESGNQSILNELKKGFTVEQAKRAIDETWNAGILPHGYLMIGAFSETKDTIRDTVRFCNETGLIGQFSITTPMPGTELYYLARQKGKLKEDDEWLLENWPEWSEKILINLTEMPDKELLRLKRAAERKIFFGGVMKNLWRHKKILNTKSMLIEGLRRARKVFASG